MIDARKLGMLSALDRLGTVAAVAQELHLTPPGVSMQLASLERELALALTERRGRRLALTPAGRSLAARGQEVLDRLSLVDLEVDGLRRGEVGEYGLAAFPSAARTFVADTWQRLAVERPGIRLSVSTPEPEGALAALTAGAVDLAIVHSYSNVPRRLPDGTHAVALATERVRLALPTGDPSVPGPVDLADLAGRRWITPTEDVTCFEMVDRACGLAGFRPDVVARSMDFAVQLELVRAGVGVALVPDLAVARVPDGVVLVETSTRLERTMFAVRRAAMRQDAVLDRLEAMLRDDARRRVGDGAR